MYDSPMVSILQTLYLLMMFSNMASMSLSRETILLGLSLSGMFRGEADDVGAQNSHVLEPVCARTAVFSQLWDINIIRQTLIMLS